MRMQEIVLFFFVLFLIQEGFPENRIRVKARVKRQRFQALPSNDGVRAETVVAAIAAVRADAAQMVAFCLNHVGAAFLAGTAH